MLTNEPKDQASGRHLQDKVALVTDPSSISGAAIVRRFADEGAQVVACPAGGERPTNQFRPFEGHPGVLVLEGDVCAPGVAQRIVDTVADQFGRLDILVNHGAGGRIVGTIIDISLEEFHKAMEGDVWSVIALSSAAIPLMAKGGGGSIVNISSIGIGGLKGRPLRCASQAAVSTLTRSMALDHGEQGIRVNALLLGPTQAMEPPSDPAELDALLERYGGHVAMRTLHTGEDTAAAALFLASDEARRVTGILLPVDVGMSLFHALA